MGELFAGRYELVDPLGHGGMGTVWRAWDHKIGGYVAAKVLRQIDAMSLLRFVREQALRIDHPHVVTPLGWAAEDDRVVFTMPLVRGGSVAMARNRFGALPLPWVAVVLDQLLDALDAVHRARVVHRDLKPANLLLEVTGRGRPHLRLSDFGIAAIIGEPRLTGPSHIIGTPGYLAPEQLSGAGPDPRQDLYAAGVVAAALLLGRGDPASAGGIQPVVRVEGPAPRHVPAALWDLLARLAAERPEDRPITAAAARAGLAATGCVPRDWCVDENLPMIVDEVPPYPPGWGPHGTTRAVAQSPQAIRSAGVAQPAPVAESAPASGGPRSTAVLRPGESSAASVAGGTTRLAAPDAEPPVDKATTGRRWLRPVLRALALGAMVGGAALMLVSAVMLMRNT